MVESSSYRTRFPTLTHQLFQLAAGTVTSDELVRRSLDAIDASQSTLNAFRVVLTKEALADAAEADRKRAAGEQLPLLGIPIAVKDDVDVAGVPTRYGADGYIRKAHQDAEVVRRLRAAGAVIVGKTNTCELGQWPFTSGPAFGHTRNPWSREHTPGGSSGGSAAAVAAGLVAAAIGSDGAGSVRIPAAWTHLVGIKPQRGRISTWPLPEAFNGITVNGVLARTVTDAALVLDAASGNVPGDLHQPPPLQVSDFVAQAPGPLKIAMSTKFPYTIFRAKLHPEIRAALESVAGQLEELGHTVRRHDPDYTLGMSWNFLSRSTSGLLDWADRLGYEVNAGQADQVQHADGPGAVGERAAQGPRPRGRRSPPDRVDLQSRRRRACPDDRAAAAGGARFRPPWRAVDRSHDDQGVPGDLAVESAGLAVHQCAGRVHVRRAADRRPVDGPGQ